MQNPKQIDGKIPKGNKNVNDDSAEVLSPCIPKENYNLFEHEYVKWGGVVRNFIAKQIKSAEDAEDIAQDVFLDLWGKFDTFDLSRDLKPLIFAIARKKALYLHRIKKRDQNYQEMIDYDEIDPDDSYEMLVVKEAELMLEHVLHDMPKQRREIYEMSVYEEMSAEKIAKKLNIRKETVYQQLSRTKKELEVRMKDMGELLMLLVLLVSG